MWEIAYYYIFLFGLICSYLFVLFFKKIALRFNIVDFPDKERKTHKYPIPLLGGVGMFIAYLSTITVNLFLLLYLHQQNLLPQEISLHLAGVFSVLRILSVLVICTLAMVTVGLIDDLRKISAKFKLVLEVILCCILFFNGIKISLFIDNQIFQVVLTFFWIIGITNAFNLLDNMDGLCALTALISSTIFLIWSLISSQIFMVLILACFCGVLSGFLFFNFPPAKIFMGDAGSLFIGFTLSILTILNTYYLPSAKKAIIVIMPLVIMAIPIFDTISVIIIRIKNRKSIFTADKNHLSHRLIKKGMSEKQSLAFICLINTCIGLGALMFFWVKMRSGTLILIQAICIVLIILIFARMKK
ncbi:MAG: MraY family glycosyltransferase [Candidatus Omnitrophota bacterium]